MARPLNKYSDEIMQRMQDMALNGCQNNTIANVLGIAKTTLERRFGKLLTKKRCERKELLRTNQTKLAETNPAMAIFLGKNELDQVDKQEIKSSGKGEPVWQPTEEEKVAITDISRSYKLRLAANNKTA